MNRILNAAAYRFVWLDDLPALREKVEDAARRESLLGTVLLAGEGINLFLAGEPQGVARFLQWLRSDVRFTDLEAKESWSDNVPFRHLRVKVKREIIRMDHPTIRPGDGRASSVDATTLRRWLDAGRDDDGRPIALLDTRNAFEVEHGAFECAVDWKLAKFGDFPRALDEHAGELAGKTVVAYCTGGIRCEKAALLMKERGLEHVHQLEGGILKYLEQTGGAHFTGKCFVFDEREALDSALSPESSSRPAP